MITTSRTTSLRTAALVSGFGLLIMVIAAPFAEMYAYPRLVVRNDILQTIENLRNNQQLFALCIMSYMVTFVMDVVVAWSLYLLFKPVHKDLSLLTAWCRIVYTVIAVAGLLNLVSVYRVLHISSVQFTPEQLGVVVQQHLVSFKGQWYFGLIFFGLHLILLGYLVAKARFIHWIFGVLLMITGAGYLLTNLQPYLFPATSIDFASYTFYGEIVFMLWLLIRGWKLKQPVG